MSAELRSPSSSKPILGFPLLEVTLEARSGSTTQPASPLPAEAPAAVDRSSWRRSHTRSTDYGDMLEADARKALGLTSVSAKKSGGLFSFLRKGKSGGQ